MCMSVNYESKAMFSPRDLSDAGLIVQESDFAAENDIALDESWDCCFCSFDVESVLERANLKWDPEAIAYGVYEVIE